MDEMLRGPFPAWRHEHRFAELPDGRTRLTDHVEYRLPAGALGRAANALLVRRLLLATFAAASGARAHCSKRGKQEHTYCEWVAISPDPIASQT